MPLATVEQKNVYNNMDSNVMVIAAPGSGKSFTMKRGVKEIFERHPYASVGIVTFTRAAIDALSDDLKNQLSPAKFSRVLINTFHGYVNQQVKKSSWKGRLLIGTNQKALVKRALVASGINVSLEDAVSIVDSIGRDVSNISISQKHTREDILLFNEYQNLCKKDQVADFNALSKFVLAGMRSGTIPRLNLTHLIVDEVQDADAIQFAWLSEHTKAGVTTAIVGDDDQTIYSFRSAGGVKIFQQFEQMFKPKIFYLNQCFRCPPSILNAAGMLIKHNQNRYIKELNTKKPYEGKVTFLCFEDVNTQLENVAKRVESDPGGWAILSRGNAHLDLLEQMLTLPVLRYGGTSFWEDMAPNEVLHFFTFLRHPNDVSLLKRVLQFFEESEEVMDFISYELSSSKVPFSKQTLPEKSNFSTISLHTLFDDFTSESFDKGVIESRFGSLEAWLNGMGRKMKNKAGQPSKTKIALDICKKWAIKDGWIKMINIAAGMVLGVKKDKKKYTRDQIVLSTLHGSKGLEWERVIIISCNIDQIPSPKTVGMSGLEEERRLLYVGMTRAEKELYVLWYGKPSMFLNESFMDVIEEAQDNCIMSDLTE